MNLLRDLNAWDIATSQERLESAQTLAKQLENLFVFIGMRRFSCNDQSHEIGVFEHKNTAMIFHLIPGGTFTLGSTEEEETVLKQKQYKMDIPEVPSITLTIEPFLIGRFVVTEETWNKFGISKQCPNIGDIYPANGISKSEAAAFLTQAGLHLPSEPEWEYACRAGSRTLFFWGNEPDPSYCWMREHMNIEDSTSYPEDRHEGKHNAFGLIDTLGNLCEWVADEPNDYDWRGTDPKPFVSGASNHILRGGCLYDDWWLCRSAVRIMCADYGDTDMGVRAAYRPNMGM